MNTNINNYIQQENDDYIFENLKENKESSRYSFYNNNDNLTEYFNNNQNIDNSYDEKLVCDDNYGSYCEIMCSNMIDANSNKWSNEHLCNDLKQDYFYIKCLFQNSQEIINSFSMSTGSNTDLLKKKRKLKVIPKDEIKPEEIKKSIDFNLDKDIDENNKEELKTEKKEQTIKIKKKTGRKPKVNKNGKNDKKAEHSKFSDDNIMRKIKTKIFDRTLKRLNQSIKFYSGEFLPLTPKMNVDLKKDLNMELLNRTIADIFGNTDLNQRYLSKGPHNKNLIEKIYKENKETETIKILSITFQDVLNEIREKYLDDFLKDIQKKEIDNEKKEENENEEDLQENIDEDCSVDKYMNDVKRLLLKYEDWFKDKKGRNVIHREKKNKLKKKSNKI